MRCPPSKYAGDEVQDSEPDGIEMTLTVRPNIHNLTRVGGRHSPVIKLSAQKVKRYY